MSGTVARRERERRAFGPKALYEPNRTGCSVDVPESMSKITGLLEAHKLLSRRAWKQLRGCINLDYP